MPLWGKKDTVYSTGNVNCTTAGVVTKQSGSIDFVSNVSVGQVLTLATDGAGPGQGIIKSIDSATQLTLDPERLDLPGAFTNVDYEDLYLTFFINYDYETYFSIDIGFYF